MRNRGLNLTYVEDEAVDFICCQIQELLNNGQSFERAFELVLEKANKERMFHIKSKLITSNTVNIMDMLNNYLKVAWRNLVRYKFNTAINLFGLVIGLVTSIIIGLYLVNQFSYDKMYPDEERLYRINTISNLGQTPRHMNFIAAPLLPALQAELPEIEMASSLAYGLIMNKPLRYNNNTIFDYKLLSTSSDFPKMFGLNIIAGNASNVYSDLNSVMISESIAKRIFSEADPIGKIFQVSDGGQDHLFKVDAVFQDLPSNTHFKTNKQVNFNMLVSNQTAEGLNDLTLSWTSINDPGGYIKLAKGANESDVSDKINDILKKNAGDDIWYEHYLQPVNDIHLNTWGYGISAEGNLNQLYLFALIGILILVIACVNYINLTTAQASVRLKEVGVRKVIGANRGQFIAQFLIEAILISTIAIILALVVVLALIPILNSQYALNIDLSVTRNGVGLLLFILTMLLLSLLCGTYPGFYLAKLRSKDLLKSGVSAKMGGGVFRKILVTLQYGTSLTLIIATLVIIDQMNYIKSKDLGFDKEEVIYINLGPRVSIQYGQPLFNEVIGKSGVVSASLTANSLGEGGMSGNGIAIVSNGEELDEIHQVLAVDLGFLETLGLEIKQGRWFSNEFATDRSAGYVVNEAFVKHFGLEEPLGIKLSRNGRDGEIVGVVKDFNFKSVHSNIEPLVMYMSNYNQFGYTNLAVRLRPGNVSQTLSSLEESWEKVIPDNPFNYTFLDVQIDQYYKSDRNFASMFQVFSALAIFVSCLGLIGLVAFTTHKRSKEIGVRKVLGASVFRILSILSMDLIKLVFVAAVIAIPLAFYAMNHWLENFEYRISISFWSFILAVAMILVISWLSVSYISIRAAKANPVGALKQE